MASAAQRAKTAAEQATKLLETVPSLPTTQPEVISSSMMVKVYQVMVDSITGMGNTGAIDAPGFISAKDHPTVTKADIEAIGGDFDWLIRSQSIVEAGYAPAS